MPARIVTNNSAKIAASVSKQMDQAVRKAAFDVEANAKVAAPVDTGFLRNSIKAESIGAKHWRVSVFASYGKFVEMGTLRHAPQPYLLPALDKVLPSLKAAMKRIKTR